MKITISFKPIFSHGTQEQFLTATTIGKMINMGIIITLSALSTSP